MSMAACPTAGECVTNYQAVEQTTKEKFNSDILHQFESLIHFFVSLFQLFFQNGQLWRLY